MKVDVKAVMEQIKREVYGDGEGRRTAIPRSLYEDIRQLCLLQHLDGEPPISSYHPRNAWIVLPIKRFLGKLMKWYVKPQAEKITERNRVESNVIQGLLRQIERLETELRRRTPPAGDAESDLPPAPADRFPDWYFALENRLRGPAEVVANLQAAYLPLFTKDSLILDLGCGRGEFLELLSRRGYRAAGVDLDPDMVAVCREKGLEVEQGDLFERLRREENASVGGIFCGQVIEHFPPEQILELISLAYHRLEAAGVLVLETLNPGCLTVFSGAYYADPTHKAPVHPEVLRYFLARTGFTDVDIWFSAPVPEEDRLELVDSNDPAAQVINENFKKLNSVLYGCAHFAAIGRRP